jgi:hypothetical protein
MLCTAETKMSERNVSQKMSVSKNLPCSTGQDAKIKSLTKPGNAASLHYLNWSDPTASPIKRMYSGCGHPTATPSTHAY